MKIVVNVLEKDVPTIKIGKKAVVTIDAYPGKKFQGTITRYSNALDLSTRTMAIEVDITNRDNLLKPGMFATVVVLVDEHRNAMTVPTQALLRDDNGFFLYTVVKNTAKRKNVMTGVEQSSRTEILSGISDTDSIVTMGQQFLKDGGQITLIK
jgi:membrane fusion protein (multidrug efflux system)